MSTTNLSTTPSTTPGLTFGIEIEGILAFHESRLTKHFSKETVVHKALSDEVERGLRSKKYPQNAYRSWAFSEEGKNQPLRRYGAEVLSIAKDLIDQHSSSTCTAVPDVVVCADKEEADYSTWQLMMDNSLCALEDEQMKQVFLGKMRGWREDCDSHGIELVSKPYALSDLPIAQSDMTALISSLTTATTGVATNDSCGLHVHIGLPSGEAFPIDVLRNLALLTIAYENHVSLLHPAHRSDGSSSDLNSNKSDRFYAEDGDPRDEFERDGQVFQSTALAFEGIRRLVSDADHTGLAKIMGDRKASSARGFVDWSRIRGVRGPATIEFRQHDGTLEAGVVGRWVRFCAGLVRLAREYARQGTPPLVEMRGWDHSLSLVGLVREMVEKDCLDEETALYYVDAYESAVEHGRDPDDGIWEEKFDHEDDALPLPDDDGGVGFVRGDEMGRPRNNLEVNLHIWEDSCASDSSSGSA